MLFSMLLVLSSSVFGQLDSVPPAPRTPDIQGFSEHYQNANNARIMAWSLRLVAGTLVMVGNNNPPDRIGLANPWHDAAWGVFGFSLVVDVIHFDSHNKARKKLRIR